MSDSLVVGEAKSRSRNRQHVRPQTRITTHLAIPEVGFLRLRSIIGDAKANIPPLIPISRAAWWAGCKTGRFPRPIKIGRATAWRAEDIVDLIERLGNPEAT